MASKKSKQVWEFGDFQTPDTLATAAVELIQQLGLKPASILEPTCGRGAFIRAASSIFSDAKSCQELKNIIQQNLGLLQTYFNALPLVTNRGILDAQEILTKLQNNFYEFQNVIETICEEILFNPDFL